MNINPVLSRPISADFMDNTEWVTTNLHLAVQPDTDFGEWSHSVGSSAYPSTGLTKVGTTGYPGFGWASAGGEGISFQSFTWLSFPAISARFLDFERLGYISEDIDSAYARVSIADMIHRTERNYSYIDSNPSTTPAPVDNSVSYGYGAYALADGSGRYNHIHNYAIETNVGYCRLMLIKVTLDGSGNYVNTPCGISPVVTITSNTVAEVNITDLFKEYLNNANTALWFYLIVVPSSSFVAEFNNSESNMVAIWSQTYRAPSYTADNNGYKHQTGTEEAYILYHGGLTFHNFFVEPNKLVNVVNRGIHYSLPPPMD